MMKNVCIQGLGFVGAAMANAVALARINNKPIYDVCGIDLPTKLGKERISKINQGIFPFNTDDKELIEAALINSQTGNLTATTDITKYQSADIIIIDLPLNIEYLEDQPQLDFSDFLNGIKVIGENISKGTLVILETTVPPGTTEKILIPYLTKVLQKREMSIDDIYLAHSYERVMPGKDYLASIRKFWRVFAGYTPMGSDLCRDFLESIIDTSNHPLTELSSITASETSKVLENTYRATNIAFIDEWTKFADQIGIDLLEIIKAIRLRPTHANLMLPGLGVGGYCLTKDPTFAPAAAKQIFNLDLKFPFSELAVKTNNQMPLHVYEIIKKLNSPLNSNSKFLVCGISYRQNVGDTRYSASELLSKALIKDNIRLSFHDPHLSFWEEMSSEVNNKELSEKDLLTFDCIIVCVAHDEYQTLEFASSIKKSRLIIDSNCIFTSQQKKFFKSNKTNIHYIGGGNN